MKGVGEEAGPPLSSPIGRLGIIGGTFDPIHVGHLAAASAAADLLGLDRVLFIPSHQPPHRPAAPRASAFQRFALVALAIAADRRFLASDLELSRPGPSFTAETLRRLHEAGYRASQLFFIIGSDAFAEIATWHDYPAVLDLAHFVVLARPGHQPAGVGGVPREAAPRLVAVHGRGGEAALEPKPGAILALSAAMPDVSSTTVRELAGRGVGLDGLVPEAVESHIRRHGLYGFANSHAGR